MNALWILVADSAHARIFQGGKPDATLTEVGCYINPEGRAHGRDITTERPPSVQEGASPTRHGITPHTTLREKSAERFARSLDATLLRAQEERKYDRLVIIAPPHFLGELKQHLSDRVRQRVVGEIPRNYTALPPAELHQHLADQQLN